MTGSGLFDVFLWQTEVGLALHILNYTNPGLMRGPVRETYSAGPLQVSIELPAGYKVARVQLLEAEKQPAFRVSEGRLRVEVPGVKELEVIAVTASSGRS